MREDNQQNKPEKKSMLDLTDVFYFAGLGLSAGGVYLIIGTGPAMFWCGCLLMYAAYKA